MRINVPLRANMLCVLILFSLSGCGVLKKKEPDPEVQIAMSGPLKPDEAEELLGEVGGNWLYGEGFGATLLNIGTVVLFPPYGLYLLGNGLISVAGYEPLHITKALPEEQQKDYDAFYSEVVSAPGRLTALLADEDYRDKEEIRYRLGRFKERVEAKRQKNGTTLQHTNKNVASPPLLPEEDAELLLYQE